MQTFKSIGSYTCDCANGFYQNEVSTAPHGQDCLSCCKTWKFDDFRCTFDSNATDFRYQCDNGRTILKLSEPGWNGIWLLTEPVPESSDNIQTLDRFVGQVLQEVTTKPCPTNLEDVNLDAIAEISCEGSVRYSNL